MKLRNVFLPTVPSIMLFALLLLPAMSPYAHAQMGTATTVQFGVDTASIATDIDNPVFNSYTLGAPERLVVDVAHVAPAFAERSYMLHSGFSAMRVGVYADKTRFVFDAAGGSLPHAEVYVEGREIVVDWSEGAGGRSGANTVTKTTSGTKLVSEQKAFANATGAPAVVNALDFNLDGSESVFMADFAGATQQVELIQPRTQGNTVRFGVTNAALPRSLRRVIDASVFPSSILQITPYSTIVDEVRNVMFAVQLKDTVEYGVALNAGVLEFRCDNSVFADSAPGNMHVSIDMLSPASGVSETSRAQTQAARSTQYQGESSEVVEQNPTVGAVLEALSSGTQINSLPEKTEAEKVYTGEPISLAFDDADIRKVMRLIGEISSMNLIVSEEVQGKISLRLQDVPWDQALDLVLEIQELGMIEKGNVVRVLPLKKIQSMETARLRAKQELKGLEDTGTAIFDINYKDAKSFEAVIKDMLSEQGKVKVIKGSKKIMVTDIPSKLDEVRDLIKELDEPAKQVMIEARIVEANTSDGLDFGVNWGFSYDNSKTGSIGTQNMDSADVGLGGSFLLPTTTGTGGLGSAFTFGRLGFDSTVLDLRISALETAGKGRVVSSPKVLTLDGEEARIEQGTSIPYQSVSQDGTTTEFEDATLALIVTPEINPDNTIILKIKASNSTIGNTVSTGAGSAPSIDTKEAETKLLLRNGETTVIGGIYVENQQDSETGTPLLKDIPFLGHLFKSRSKSNTRNELLIFITPRIAE
ncbi:MAG: type IV pilus secretin PilQ [Desulfuromonadaceae bacterium]|nr:type IV pilus secretin PilQ [Desulfuromonadaceae bacterium]